MLWQTVVLSSVWSSREGHKMANSASGWHTLTLSLVSCDPMLCGAAPLRWVERKKAGSPITCHTIVSFRKPGHCDSPMGRKGIVSCVISVKATRPWLLLAPCANVARFISSEESKPLRNRNSSYNTQPPKQWLFFFFLTCERLYWFNTHTAYFCPRLQTSPGEMVEPVIWIALYWLGIKSLLIPF